jgi:putative ABC transport system substrate-binding protein
MVQSLRRLSLGFVLIAAAAAVLLLSDLGSRVSNAAKSEKNRTLRVAILQHASQAILEQGRDSMIRGLKEKGWEQGKNLELKLYNAEGDNAVSQTIAKEMVGGGYDLLMTISTVSLQAVAHASRRKPFAVFGSCSLMIKVAW